VLNQEKQNDKVWLQQNNLSQNEQILYNMWLNAVTETEQLKGIIAELQKQIEQLKTNNLATVSKTPKRVPSKAKEFNTNKDVSPILTMWTPPKNKEYSTDEEQLAKDTEWIRVKRKAKKRKINATPSPPTPISRPTKNLGKQEKEPAKKTTKENTPPPIIVDDFQSYDIFYETLTGRVPESNLQVKLINKTTAKINCIDSECYREVIETLSQNKYLYHTYENKQIRPIRVIAKNLHYSCNPDKIVAFLKEKNYNIISAVNKRSWKDKQPLNMFMLSFDNSENIEKIYKITNILGSKVEVLPLRSNRIIPQCKNCQGFGHTQRFCSKETKCVKCAGKHSTKHCTKTKEQEPKCVNCGENHPANYRGCYVAKELQKIRNKKYKKPKKKVTISATEKQQVRKNEKSQNKTSYASVLASEPNSGAYP
jgi:hypothetical protein